MLVPTTIQKVWTNVEKYICQSQTNKNIHFDNMLLAGMLVPSTILQMTISWLQWTCLLYLTEQIKKKWKSVELGWDELALLSTSNCHLCSNIIIFIVLLIGGEWGRLSAVSKSLVGHYWQVAIQRCSGKQSAIKQRAVPAECNQAEKWWVAAAAGGGAGAGEHSFLESSLRLALLPVQLLASPPSPHHHHHHQHHH